MFDLTNINYENFLFGLIAVITIVITARCIKYWGFLGQCRKLAKKYNARIKVLHTAFYKLIFSKNGPDVEIFFGDQKLLVIFIYLKSKSTVRFTGSDTYERIRYTKAIVPAAFNKGLTPSYHLEYGQGSEVSPKISKSKFLFKTEPGALNLILFSSEPSSMLVFDEKNAKNIVLGDGGMAYEYYVGGKKFIKRWLDRN